MYAIIAGFALLTIWQGYDNAEAASNREANALLDLYRLAGGIRDEVKRPLQSAIADYSKTVVQVEWENMASGVYSAQIGVLADHIWRRARDWTPKTPKEEIIYGALLEQLAQFSEDRRSRLLAAESRVHPVIWVVLVTGAYMTIFFTYFFSGWR